jgi:hypothetical protein
VLAALSLFFYLVLSQPLFSLFHSVTARLRTGTDTGSSTDTNTNTCVRTPECPTHKMTAFSRVFSPSRTQKIRQTDEITGKKVRRTEYHIWENSRCQCTSFLSTNGRSVVRLWQVDTPISPVVTVILTPAYADEYDIILYQPTRMQGKTPTTGSYRPIPGCVCNEAAAPPPYGPYAGPKGKPGSLAAPKMAASRTKSWLASAKPRSEAREMPERRRRRGKGVGLAERTAQKQKFFFLAHAFPLLSSTCFLLAFHSKDRVEWHGC